MQFLTDNAWQEKNPVSCQYGHRGTEMALLLGEEEKRGGCAGYGLRRKFIARKDWPNLAPTEK